MRRSFFASVVGDGQVVALIPLSKWFESGAIVDTPDVPFGVIRWGPLLKHGPNLTTRTVQVWAHQARGSYDIINDVLTEVTRVAAGLSQVQTPWDKGVDVLTQADFAFGSGELFDREYKTNCRYVEFRCTGRER